MAHRSAAKLFVVSGDQIRTVKTFEFPDGRRQNREIDTDAKGSRYSSSAGRSAPTAPFRSRQQKHGLDPQMEAAEHLADGFAHELCHYIYLGRTQNKFEELIVVAEPGFLGKIRRFLDKQSKLLLSRAISQNWADLPKKQLQNKLQELAFRPTRSGLTRAA